MKAVVIVSRQTAASANAAVVEGGRLDGAGRLVLKARSQHPSLGGVLVLLFDGALRPSRCF